MPCHDHSFYQARATHAAVHGRRSDPAADGRYKAGALLLFSVLDIPLAVTYSVPFAPGFYIFKQFSSWTCLSLGVLNLAIVVPQMFVSVASGGPWDGRFGGGNLPAFIVGAVAAAASGILAFTMLLAPPADALVTKAMTAGGFH